MKENVTAEVKDASMYGSIESIYKDFREEFIQWMYKTYSCPKDDAVEIYQVAIVIVYENIIAGKLKELKSSIKTYLFGVGKNKYLERRRERSRFIHDWDFNLGEDEQDKKELSEEREREVNKVMHCLNELGEKCKGILQMYYYQNLTMEEIAAALDYKNADTVKNLKYKCMNRLRNMFKEKYGGR